MLPAYVVLYIAFCSRDVSIQNVPDHSAVANGLRVLASNEPQHAMGNIFGSIRAKLTALDDIQPFTFQAKVNFLARVKRLEHDVLPPEFLAR